MAGGAPVRVVAPGGAEVADWLGAATSASPATRVVAMPMLNFLLIFLGARGSALMHVPIIRGSPDAATPTKVHLSDSGC
ncbi:hypothetical protein GCM10010197_29190 [Nocardioides luteus]|uniref:Uncharacterized protein n=1 Tax=Nocardioides luteus TaxID=1844 RepID=A0ABQ5SRY2_9ACTN|nr:hypothetical protein GCM10010197_29190 [Nocardioides luteus]GLJ66420.1 hypothetical protein GCM10017579_04560 [Nocardioides luteus]